MRISIFIFFYHLLPTFTSHSTVIAKQDGEEFSFNKILFEKHLYLCTNIIVSTLYFYVATMSQCHIYISKVCLIPEPEPM